MAHRIMIVDDEPNILRALQRVLSADDMEVETYASAEDALRRAQVTAFDLFMIDYHMPHMDGIALLQALKSLQPEAVRMMVSGMADFEMMVKAVNETGIHHFVTKPWQDYELRLSVRSALDRRRLEMENRRLADELRQSEATCRRQRAELERLERENPGLTRVDWGADGRISLREE